MSSTIIAIVSGIVAVGGDGVRWGAVVSCANRQGKQFFVNDADWRMMDEKVHGMDGYSWEKGCGECREDLIQQARIHPKCYCERDAFATGIWLKCDLSDADWAERHWKKQSGWPTPDVAGGGNSALASSGFQASQPEDMSFEDYSRLFDKDYYDYEEKRKRKQIFESNKMMWRRPHGLGAAAPHESGAVLGPTLFSDLTLEEFQALNLFGARQSQEWFGLPKLGVHAHQGEQLAASIDWTSKGAVTPVKNQGQCGSCWAFSAVGGLEGSWQIATGKLMRMSEQQFVDCDKKSSGCNGGWMTTAFSFAKGTAIATESSYAYTGRDDSCKSSFSAAIPQGGVIGYTLVSDSVSSLKSALNSHPVSVAIQADQAAFQHYIGGVISSGCGSKINHAVLAVGYKGNTIKVKNSWGSGWGVNGYAHIDASQCGITKLASYPTVSGPLGGPGDFAADWMKILRDLVCGELEKGTTKDAIVGTACAALQAYVWFVPGVLCEQAVKFVWENAAAQCKSEVVKVAVHNPFWDSNSSCNAEFQDCSYTKVRNPGTHYGLFEVASNSGSTAMVELHLMKGTSEWSKMEYGVPPCARSQWAGVTCGRTPTKCVETGYAVNIAYLHWNDKTENRCKYVSTPQATIAVDVISKSWFYSQAFNLALALYDGFQPDDVVGIGLGVFSGGAVRQLVNSWNDDRAILDNAMPILAHVNS